MASGCVWSGKHHQTVRGINLITLYYTDIHDQHQPINFRVYNKREGKTKNDYFQEMLITLNAVNQTLYYSINPHLESVRAFLPITTSARL
jgi:hypothetical protein